MIDYEFSVEDCPYCGNYSMKVIGDWSKCEDCGASLDDNACSDDADDEEEWN